MTSFLKSAALVALCALASCTKPLETASYSVVPLPSEVTPSEGTPFRLNSRTSVFYPTGNALLKRNAEFLSEYVAQSMNFALPVREQAEGEAPEHAITLVLDSTINNEEGYRLSVTEKSIRIEGRTEQGIFYGIQTLRKSLPAVAESKSILLPAAVVNDEPRFTYRAMHLDVCRHFFPVEFVKKYIDLLALHNMNTFHWHLTDDQGWRIESKKYPKLNEIGSVRHRTVVGYLGSGEYDNTDYGDGGLCWRGLSGVRGRERFLYAGRAAFRRRRSRHSARRFPRGRRGAHGQGQRSPGALPSGHRL